MTHVITHLCLRDGGCTTVCPVECIIPGKPQEEWPLFYIDPDTCIDCGACIPECPWEAIFTEDEVPTAHKAKEGQRLSMPVGTPGYDTPYDGKDHNGDDVHIDATRIMETGEIVDLTPSTQWNADFFVSGPGYNAL